MSSKGPTRRFVFFALALLLPSGFLLLVGVQFMRQDAELEERRADDRLELVARLWTDSLYQTLEGAYASADDTPGRWTSNGLLDLGAYEQGQLSLRHESGPSSSMLVPQFQNFLIEAARLEVGQGKPAQAAVRYESRLSVTELPVQRAVLMQRAARAHRAAGNRERMLRHAQAVLALPDSIRDEYGTPMAFYAADLLLAEGDTSVVQDRLGPAPTGWLTTGARSMYEAVPVRRDSAAFATFEAEHRLIETVREINVLRDRSPGAPRWVSDPSGRWLVRLVDGGRVDPERLVAVRMAELSAGPIQQVTAMQADDRPMGGPFRGVAARLQVGDRVRWGRALIIGSGLALLLGLALFSGFLLWRDVRRETRLSHLRSQFVSSVSHELRTPLTSIRLYAESMRAFGGDDSAVQRDRDLEVIASESERLTRMLDNVLNTSRIERGTMQYRFELGDISDPVERAARSMHYVFATASVPLRLDNDSSWTILDPDAIEQAVLNLLSNALKYGSGTPVELACGQSNGHAFISVRDYGPGLGPDAHQRIFERFHREDDVIRRNIPGAGLGLSLVRHIADAHDGSVTVDSSVDGSIFTLSLPLRDS